MLVNKVLLYMYMQAFYNYTYQYFFPGSLVRDSRILPDFAVWTATVDSCVTPYARSLSPIR